MPLSEEQLQRARNEKPLHMVPNPVGYGDHIESWSIVSDFSEVPIVTGTQAEIDEAWLQLNSYQS